MSYRSYSGCDDAQVNSSNDKTFTLAFPDLLGTTQTSKKFRNGPKSGPWTENFKTKAVGAERVFEEGVWKRIKCYNGRLGGHSAGIA